MAAERSENELLPRSRSSRRRGVVRSVNSVFASCALSLHDILLALLAPPQQEPQLGGIDGIG